jgi:diacylglycerol O-acyltransferase
MTAGPDRLHALDTLWAEMQDDGPPIAIGTAAVGRGGAPSRAEVQALLAGRLDRMPRLAQEPNGGTWAAHRPEWVDSPRFALERHVHHLDTPPASAPGHPERWWEVAVGRVMEQALPADQPLWDLWVVPGPQRQWALVWRVHHAVSDGLGALSLLGHGFDLRPDGGPTLAEAVAQQAVASRAGQRHLPPGDPPEAAPAEDLPGRGVGPGRLIGEGLGAIRRVIPHARPAIEALLPHPPGPLTAPVGPGRTWASTQVPLGQARGVGRRLGATVNDVVLGSVAGGFADLLEHRGRDPARATVRTLVPVSMRPRADDRSHNELSGMLVHLPVGVADPVQRVRAVRAELSHSRDFGTPLLASLFVGIVDRAVPASLQDLSVAVAGRTVPAWFLDTVTTNVPGPQFPVFLCGRPVTAMYPVIPIAGHTCITVGIFSYDGTLHVGVTGDSQRAADVDVLARGISRAATALVDQVASTAD